MNLTQQPDVKLSMQAVADVLDFVRALEKRGANAQLSLLVWSVVVASKGLEVSPASVMTQLARAFATCPPVAFEQPRFDA